MKECAEKKYTHDELCEIAVRWLNRRTAIAVSEIRHGAEIPDAIGFCGYGTVLIECKTSRGDFLKDFKKGCRKSLGLGNYRYFMCPWGMVDAKELPPKWGLLWIKNGRVYLQSGARYYGHSNHEQWLFESDKQTEWGILIQVARRLKEAFTEN
ncbi:hypothetical protein VF14_18295 [Nostoc linckia z18]|uniref:Uncharacterized protein n=3 Tax=Nostoc linckia TaxID=92942 RepID=A0A9Q5Z960_NOSLI|nr:hypothetical protein [Nostoc linckia]PHJ52793.1 hypothetical protein VF02_37505 [Nostoc linckia z1]PHJ82014.1 hypothetical protein VF07_29235 [Nostoc linckia z6]PHJ92877.1 hypothetical protein VF04_27950 [Nostoc linckia z7]PHK00828.1 hypothetical protein VF08_23295 [Nostoc linckia z8]PHK03111.1 hypothetical protein VF10_38455 [Nostoc linckia z13]